MKEAQGQEAYDNFLMETESPWCWACGAGATERPANWYAPFLVERAHIVSAPRVEDRRVVILLCSLCHKLSHGLEIAGVSLPPIGIEAMLWLKMRFDPGYYDRAFMGKHSVRLLPKLRAIPGPYSRRYKARRLYYPWENISPYYGTTNDNGGRAKKTPGRDQSKKAP